MRDPAITVSDLSKKFGSFTAVDRISFQVEKGEVFGFLGPNGAGKTTTIRMLCGLMDPSAGNGTVGGFNIKTERDKIKQNIGYMSQKFSLYEDLTVGENIDLYAGVYQTQKAKRKEKKAKVLAQAELTGKENILTSHLANSVKQHLALGCAVIHDPQIVFLDEPTAGVDPLSRKKFWGIIKEQSQRGVTTLVTTHYMDEAERCDRVALINNGRIIACDTPKDLKTKEMPGGLIEIDCSNVMQGLELLRKQDFIRDVSLYGLFLHVLLEDPGLAEKLRTVLEQGQLQVRRIEKITPSLEDVFVFLVEAQK